MSWRNLLAHPLYHHFIGNFTVCPLTDRHPALAGASQANTVILLRCSSVIFDSLPGLEISSKCSSMLNASKSTCHPSIAPQTRHISMNTQFFGYLPI
ncbi:MAG TPA: hypothetical protein VHV10_17670 [Ktedonobacteraceae bacterium]|nr:hypothetical protein [Ktedonobacteraceae bacterium]